MLSHMGNLLRTAPPLPLLLFFAYCIYRLLFYHTRPGFVIITSVDLDRGTMKVLSPSPRPLPKGILLQTDIHVLDLDLNM